MKWFLFFCCTGLLLVSCTNRPVSPSKASRRAIDTIFQLKVIALQPKMDIYKVAVDSILEERMAEMNELVE